MQKQHINILEIHIDALDSQVDSLVKGMLPNASFSKKPKQRLAI